MENAKIEKLNAIFWVIFKHCGTIQIPKITSKNYTIEHVELAVKNWISLCIQFRASQGLKFKIHLSRTSKTRFLRHVTLNELSVTNLEKH